MRTATLAMLCVAVLIWAGCAAAPTEQSERLYAGPPQAPEPTVADELGSIAGRVVDDEERPIRNADVAITPGSEVTRTDEQGRFTFNGLEPGRYVLLVKRAGFEEATRALDVVAGLISDVRFALVQVVDAAASPPRLERFNQQARYSVAVAETIVNQYWYAYLKDVAPDVRQQCSGCVWVVELEEKGTEMLLELEGSHSVANPQGDSEQVTVDAWVDGKISGILHAGESVPMPGSYLVIEDRVKRANSFQWTLSCERFWFCYQETREVWVTVAYKMEIPDDYSAFDEDEES